MNCKYCNSPMQPDAQFCSNCGKKHEASLITHCDKCGHQMTEFLAFCPNCGNNLSTQSSTNPASMEKASRITANFNSFSIPSPAQHQQPKANGSNFFNGQPRYKNYTDATRKTVIFDIILYGIAILLTIITLFVPMFKMERTVNSLDDMMYIVDEDDYEDVLEDGDIDKSFSFANEFSLLINGIFEGEGSAEASAAFYLSNTMLILLILTLLIVLIMSSVKLFQCISGLNDIDNFTMLKYNEINKSGNTQKRRLSLYHQLLLYTLPMSLVFDIIFPKALVKRLYDIGPSSTSGYPMRHMLDVSGITIGIMLPILLIAGCIVIIVLKKKEEKAMTIAIAREDIA
ncbi:MAG: zinc ribbon domain-containing protein [Clostridia bacterium]|nr:zinc ribbon domain-containing protein [Clostridia bacterium]